VLGPLYYGLGRCNFALFRFAKARESYLLGREVLKELRRTGARGFVESAQSEYLLYVLCDLGLLCINIGDFVEAREFAIEGLALIESLEGAGKPMAQGAVRYGIAEFRATLGRVAS